MNKSSDLNEKDYFVPQSQFRLMESQGQQQSLQVDRNVIEQTMCSAIVLDISAQKITATLAKLITLVGGDILNIPFARLFRLI